jgi:hypothetical protein
MPTPDGDDDHSGLAQQLGDSPSVGDVNAAAAALLGAQKAVAPTTPAKEHFSPLSRIPLDIEDQREHLFTLDQPLTFDQVSWDKYWPYV